MTSTRQIESIRAFNRFYTRQIGLLREGLLETPFSLTQARVLYEIGARPGVRAVDLVRDLGLDPGYFSRLLKTFARQGLVRRAASAGDRRVSLLTLSTRGRAAFHRLNTRSRDQIGASLAALGEADRDRLVDAMAAIHHLLDPPAHTPGFVVRTHRPGDIGWVVARHGALYAREYGWDSTFEGLVARIAGDFLTRFDEARERCWIAERHGFPIGSVFLVKQSKTVARLRLLLVEPSTRGLGVGTRLVGECIAFARQAGYRRLTLWTDNRLHAARRIYQRAGFQLVGEEPHRSFGHDLVSQTWELALNPPRAPSARE